MAPSTHSPSRRQPGAPNSTGGQFTFLARQENNASLLEREVEGSSVVEKVAHMPGQGYDQIERTLDGSSYFTCDGILNREDGPAIEGTLLNAYYRNGVIDREGGPALVWADGGEAYLRDGEFDREDGPAVITPGVGSFWYRDGQLHRENGPAVTTLDCSMWFDHDRVHRDDGPAVEYANGRREFWVDGVKRVVVTDA